MIGTPGYMAPENALSVTVDRRADLYSLGCVAYYLRTGRQVFEGETVMQGSLDIFRPPRCHRRSWAPSPVPPGLEQLVLECLAKKPEDWPASAAEIDRRLSAVDVELWTDADARQWWAATKPSSGDLDGNVDTSRGGRAPGESATRLAIDLRETSSQNEN